MTTFAKVTRRPEFEKDLKQLLKRYRSLEEDLNVIVRTQLVLFHKHKIDNRGLVHINHLGIEQPKIFKAVKFACKSLQGRGAASGIRLTYAYFEEADHIEFIQIYFKGDEETEDRERLRRLYARSEEIVVACEELKRKISGEQRMKWRKEAHEAYANSDQNYKWKEIDGEDFVRN